MASRHKFLAAATAGVWIVGSEFARNELLFKHLWVGHFSTLGLRFETLPLNGMLWTVWGFALGYLVAALLGRFSFGEAVFLAWLAAFPMMWLTLHNLQVLPPGLLVAAIPLSVVEVVVAAAIVRKLTKGPPQPRPS